MHIIDIGWIQLAFGFLILLIPAFILIYYKTGLVNKLVIAAVRMVLQLLFVGYYLEYLFKLDNPWLNIAWVAVMIIVSDFATLDRSGLKIKRMFWPVLLATFLGIALVSLFFLKFIIQLKQITTAQYLIPIIGMVLGNCLRSNVIGIHSFFYSLRDKKLRYYYYLSVGATRKEALFPFMRDALKEITNPTLATMATIGLVSLPGMMTGQILSGSSPLTAIRYQIMIMIAILTGTILSVFLALLFGTVRAFDAADRFDEQLLTE